MAALMGDQLHTTDEGFKRLGVGKTTGFGLIYYGEIRSIKIGRKRLIPQSAIDEFIQKKLAEQAPSYKTKAAGPYKRLRPPVGAIRHS